MIDASLIELLESVLGKGRPTSRGNYAFMCPNGCHPTKPKLEICLDPTEVNTKGKPIYQHYSCWSGCGLKGELIKTLFKKIHVYPDKYDELKLIVGDGKVDYSNLKKVENITPVLPEEFKSLMDRPLSIEGKHALNYLLKDRNLTLYDVEKYNLGYCEEGKYSNRIIIPSYDNNGKLNYFISRTYLKGGQKKYDSPDFSRDIIFFELFINWDLPIILCEGVFDAISLKRNVIPLLGNNITHNLMKKLIESKVEKIYLALDNDVLKKSLEHCELLMNEGKKVYLVDLPKKDPSDIGFVNMLDILYKTEPLDLFKLMELKFKI